jgi:hypothetical protein
MVTETTLTEEEILAQVPAARERGRIARETEPRAVAARYNRRTKRIEVELTNGCLFAFPAELGQGLQAAGADQLAAVEITPTGDGLHWEELDADLYVPALVRGVFGTERWMAELGRAGGRSTSEAKAAAARANGRKGGRPRKPTAP